MWQFVELGSRSGRTNFRFGLHYDSLVPLDYDRRRDGVISRIGVTCSASDSVGLIFIVSLRFWLRLSIQACKQVQAIRVCPRLEGPRWNWRRVKWPKGECGEVDGSVANPLALVSSFLALPSSTRKPVNRLPDADSVASDRLSGLLIAYFHLLDRFSCRQLITF